MTGDRGAQAREPGKIVIGTDVGDGGVAVTVNGKPALTPKRHPLVLPGVALAEAVAAELAEAPARITGKGLNDPAAAPNFRLALGAIDRLGNDPGARARTVDDLSAYGETDLVCFHAETPEGLAAAQAAAFAPLLDWFEKRFGARLTVTTGLCAVSQDRAALDAIRRAVEGCDDFTLAALALATRTAGSIVIGLALIGGAVDAETAYSASAVDEIHQAERWGEDAEAARVRAGKAQDLAQAEQFIALLAQG